MTTIYDVARIAGVSAATVSHVINKTKRFSPATTTRVQSAIAQLKFVARPIRRVPARQDTIAISVTSELNAVSESSVVVHSGQLPTPGVSSAVYPSQKRDALKPITAASATTRAMLRIVRAAQPISRADLARRLAVRRSTITELVKPLMASGLLREGAPKQIRSRIGRPPVGLSLRDESRFFIGVNIGVRRTQVGAALVDGQILAEESYDTPVDSGIALAQVRASIDRLRTSISDRTISAIGVSVPGPTDAERKRLLFAPHLGWRDVEIAKALRLENIARARKSNHEVPIIVENDATAAAMYELRSRLRNSNSREPGDFVLVRAGTGIGVGLVIGGEIYAGSGMDGGLLGEFGHMTIVAGGKSCVCGNRGCWERYASASSAASLYAGDRRHARDSSPLRFVDIVARAAAGERRAQVTLERIGDYLGIGIANIISALGIARIVVSGRIVLGWKFIEGSLHQSVARTMVGRLATWSIQPGEPSGAGLGGALEVVIEQHLNAIVAETRSAA